MLHTDLKIPLTPRGAFAPLLLAAALLALPVVGRAQFMDVVDGNAVDQVSPAGTVSLLATLPPSAPVGIVFDKAGNAYVTEHNTDQIAKITPSGTVSTFATLPSGTGPEGIVFDGNGNFYTSDTGTGQITKITANGVASVFATLSSRGYGLAIDPSGFLYTSYYDASGTISRISPTGQVSPFANLGAGSGPDGLVTDALGNVYAADQNIDAISRITPTGSVSTFATLPSSTGPVGVAFDRSGNLYTSAVNGKVYEISPNGQSVTIFASGINNADLLAIYVPEPTSWAVVVMGVLVFVVLRPRGRNAANHAR